VKGFREFLLRGNVVDLAVAVVIGGAFGLVVKALVTDFILPLVGIPGGRNISDEAFSVHGAEFKWGDFVNTVINFVLIAAAIYFVVVVPMARISRLRAKPAIATTRPCPYCVSDIPVAATRCAFCTSEVTPA
jgi:large conductance mechanosensitive channel